ncbi:hypothetical protein [Bacillus fonticola]|uniref:hypothetical protein n=1 Tax=Bacillus fonticola TaxID=2728853 RepID=UPI0014751B60|nr:hypothetical protein [Bacillus fonticola]
MKWLDWIIVILLVAIGIICLSISLTLTSGVSSFDTYVSSLLSIFLWFGLPVLVLSIIYWYVKKR